MSQSPWKINEGSFLYQITFIYYTCFLLKTRTPCRSLDPGLERRCWEWEGQPGAGVGGFTSLWGKDHPWDSALGFHRAAQRPRAAVRPEQASLGLGFLLCESLPTGFVKTPDAMKRKYELELNLP